MDSRTNNRGGPARKDGRGSKDKPPPGRRVPPSETTGLEERYLRDRADAAGDVLVVLRDGGRVDGRIRESNADTITIVIDDGPELMIRKQDILYLEESGAQQPEPPVG